MLEERRLPEGVLLRGKLGTIDHVMVADECRRWCSLRRYPIGKTGRGFDQCLEPVGYR